MLSPITIVVYAAVIVAQTDSPEAVIRQAIKSCGRAEGDRLLKISGVEKRIYKRDVVETVSVQFEIIAARDNRYRSITSWQEDEGKIVQIAVHDGKRLWLSTNGIIQPFTDIDISVSKDADYHELVSRLDPLLDEKRFSLQMLSKVAVNGEQCIGVRVKSAGQPDTDLYFGEKDYLLRRRISTGITTDGKQQEFSNYFSDYKRIAGVAMPMTKKTVFGDGYAKVRVTNKVEFIPAAQAVELFKKPE